MTALPCVSASFRHDSRAFGFHLRNQCADVVSAQSEERRCQFLSRPSPQLEPSGTVTTAAEADPVAFEAMATKQNRCAETQHLLSGSSLKLAV